MSKAYSETIEVTEVQFDALVGMELGLEYIDGRLVQVAPTFTEHGILIVKLSYIFVDYLRKNNLGNYKNVMVDVLHRIPNGRRRAPDIAYHKEFREPLKGLQISPPDLAIEIRSDTETDDDVEDKLNDLFSLGTAVIWVVNLKERKVEVYKSWVPNASLANQECESYVLRDILDASPVIPGLKISISDLFDL
ncbi:Uma2 family endonuclease [Candidatus Poribacteria bacterium]|nr:Uma2 family endonuclease [Candidatus Poribacteria bacterium]